MLNLQSWTKADDIRDFEIEGMSIGDSLLDFFSKKKIEQEKFFEAEQGSNKEVARFYIREKKGNYDWIVMSFKTSDKKYMIIELSGFIFMPFNKCLKKRDEINKEVENIFNESEKQATGTIEHFLDKKSFVNHVAYWTSKTLNDYVSLTCYDWSNKSGYDDQLRIEAISNEYHTWLSSLQNN
jgi:hypothetical protein